MHALLSFYPFSLVAFLVFSFSPPLPSSPSFCVYCLMFIGPSLKSKYWKRKGIGLRYVLCLCSCTWSIRFLGSWLPCILHRVWEQQERTILNDTAVHSIQQWWPTSLSLSSLSFSSLIRSHFPSKFFCCFFYVGRARKIGRHPAICD